jgi:hypothetical protein
MLTVLGGLAEFERERDSAGERERTRDHDTTHHPL